MNKQIAQLEPREAKAIFRFETEKERKGRIEGYREGMQQGMQQALRQTAKRMLQMGKSIDEIVEITGLPKDEIRSLQ